MISALIFDFNGTLLFDTPAHSAAWREFLQEKTGRGISEQEMRENVQGRPNPEILRHFLGELSDAEIRVFAGEKEAKYRELCLRENDWFKLADGVETMFDRLREKGVPFTIATSSEWENVSFYFEQLGLDRWFTPETLVFADGKMAGKPAPDIYLRAMKLLGKEPGQCAVFEDSMAGIASARNAGAGKIVAVDSDWDRETLLKTDGVTDVLSDFRIVGNDLPWFPQL